jgi:phage tail protein X
MVIDAAVRFTREYLRVLIDRLRISIDGTEVWGDPRSVNDITLERLKADLGDLMQQDLSRDAICSAPSFTRDSDGGLQTLAYGFVPDFDLMVKLGFLMGQRVVLWDLIWSRFLHNDAGVEAVCHIAMGLVAWQQVAERGALVILPDPSVWDHETSSRLDQAVSDDPDIPNADYGLLKAHSICHRLGLSPYTLSHDVVGEHSGLHAALANLLRWKSKFEWISDVKPQDYHRVIEENPELQMELRMTYNRLVGGNTQLQKSGMEAFPAIVARTIDKQTKAARRRLLVGDLNAVAYGCTAGTVVYGLITGQLVVSLLGAAGLGASMLARRLTEGLQQQDIPVLGQVFTDLRKLSPTA